MKIICIGRNYSDHAKELNNPVPEEPVFFMKPDTAYLKGGGRFFYPDWTEDVHYETELVLRIGKMGKHIAPEFARKYIEGVGIGWDLTARDVQKDLKAKGLPWEKAKAFDDSAPVSKEFLPFSDIPDSGNISFHAEKNGEVVQKGNSSDMIFSFERIIAHVSQFITLKTGDLIMTGTPQGVGPLAIGDELKAFIGRRQLVELEVK